MWDLYVYKYQISKIKLPGQFWWSYYLYANKLFSKNIIQQEMHFFENQQNLISSLETRSPELNTKSNSRSPVIKVSKKY